MALVRLHPGEHRAVRRRRSNALLGSEVRDAEDSDVGRLRDVIVDWRSSSAHPPVTALLVVGDRAQTLCVAIVGTLSAVVLVQTVVGWF